MINIYIKDYNKNGRVVSSETLMQKIPADSEGGLRLISPIVKAEMGQVEGFDFSIESGTPFYDAFLQMKTFIRVVYDGTTIFYGRVLTIDNNGFRGTRKVRCEGPLAFLMDSPVEGVEESKRSNSSTHDYMQELINSHNSFINNEANKRFMLGEVPGQYSGWVSSAQRVKNDTHAFGSDSWTDTKSALEDLRSHYGGYFRARPAGGIGAGIYLDWMNHYFNPNTINQKIEVGKNILDISNVTEIDNVFTAIVPIGKHNVSTTTDGKTSSKREDLYIDGKVIRVPEVCDHFSYGELSEGYHRYEDYRDAISRYGMIIKQVSFPDAETKEKLRSDALEWIKNNYQGEVTKFTIKAIDMHQIGENVSKINVGDRVTIVYPVAKEDGTFPKQSTTQTCLSIQYDLYHPENNSYTFGIPANILTKTYGTKKQAKSVNNAATTPTPTSSGTGGGKSTKDWFQDYVKPWLQRHKLHYNPPEGKTHNPIQPTTHWPYPQPGNTSCDGYMSGEYLLSTLNKRAVQGSKVRDSVQPPPGTSVVEQYKWVGNIQSYANVATGLFTEDLYRKWHVGEYIQWEYGIDLDTYWSGVSPSATTDDGEGKTTFWGFVKDSVTGVVEGIQRVVTILNLLNGKYTEATYDDDGNLTSYKDEEGILHWYVEYEDPETGQVVKKFVNQRSLKLEQVYDPDSFIGSRVTQTYADPDGTIHTYNFGQAIEEWADTAEGNSKLVVAHVDGDVIKMGSERSQYSTVVGRKIAGNFLDPVLMVMGRDPKTGDPRGVMVGSSGQVSFRARWDASKNSYVYDENGPVTVTGDGFWDTSNLAIKGGLYTIEESPGVYVTYVKSSQLVVGGKNTKTTVLSALRGAGLLDVEDDDKVVGLVAQTVYAQDINAINVRCQNIETYWVKTEFLYSKISQLPAVYSQKVNTKLLTANDIVVTKHIIIPSVYEYDAQFPITDCISDLKVVPLPNGYQYKLQRKSYATITEPGDQSGGWVDIPNTTFNGAARVTGSWSGGIFTVRNDPENSKAINIPPNTISTTGLKLRNSGGTSRSGKNISQLIKVWYFDPDLAPYTSDPYQTTGHEETVTIDASSVYTYGHGEGFRQALSDKGIYVSDSTITWPALRLQKNGSVSKSEKSVSQTVYVQYRDANAEAGGAPAPYYTNTNISGTVSIDASSVWSDGDLNGYARAAGKTKVNGSPTISTSFAINPGGSITVTAPVKISGSETSLDYVITATTEGVRTTPHYNCMESLHFFRDQSATAKKIEMHYYYQGTEYSAGKHHWFYRDLSDNYQGGLSTYYS